MPTLEINQRPQTAAHILGMLSGSQGNASRTSVSSSLRGSSSKITCLGSAVQLSESRYRSRQAGVSGNKSAARLNSEIERKRFTAEDLIGQIRCRLGFGVQILKDGRGDFCGGRVRLLVAGSVELVVSTLSVMRKDFPESGSSGKETENAENCGSTEYVVWKIEIDQAEDLKPLAGRGKVDLDLCVRKVRRAVKGY